MDTRKLYRIESVKTDEGEEADIIFIDQQGEWLAKRMPPLHIPVGAGNTIATAMLPVKYYPLKDNQNNFVPAPADWRDLVLEELGDDDDEAVLGQFDLS